MAELTTWPDFENDQGDLQTGTVLTEANLGVGDGTNSMKAAIEAVIHNPSNPTETPATVIAEVVTARGSKASLDGRLDVSLNEDGTLKTQAGLTTTAELQASFGIQNWLANDDFKLWSRGDAAAPDYWVHDNTGGGTIARTNVVAEYIGDNKVTLVFGTTLNALYQVVVPTGNAWNRMANLLKGAAFGFGVWVKASTANQVRAYIYDGSGTTESAYHTGSGNWEFLALTRTLSQSGTQLITGIKIVAGAAFPVVIGEGVAFPTEKAPSRWVPCNTVLAGTLHFVVPGTLSVTNNVGYKRGLFNPWKAGRVEQVQLAVESKNTGADVQVDVSTSLGVQVDEPGAPTAAVGAATGLTGDYHYWVTFVDVNSKHTALGTVSNTITLANQKGNLTGIPLGPAASGDFTGTTARKIYRNKNGDLTRAYLHSTIADNSTTTLTGDNTADGSLGAEATGLTNTIEYASMFSTLPAIAAGARYGSAVPDGGYKRRCFSKLLGTARLPGDRVIVDLLQVGSTLPGTELQIEVRTLQYVRPHERFLDPGDL